MTGDLAGRAPVGDRLRRHLAQHRRPPEFPDKALYGLSGEIVRSIEPLTEASAPAMLITLLCGFSAMVGRGPYVSVGSARHHAQLFAVVVGDSARARKGTSKAAIMPVLQAAGPEVGPFLRDRVLTGVASGEALVHAAANGVHGESDDMEPSAADHRLWVIEEEYGRLLTVAARRDSTLSAVVRQAWDGARLENRTKATRLRVDQAHLCILGHVTQHDLADKLTTTDLGNGSANRFLYVFSRRSRLLPEPIALSSALAVEYGERLQKALNLARTAGELRRTPAFSNEWTRYYLEVEGQGTGGGPLYEQLTARAAAQTLRLALVYALLDGADALDVEHLQAAEALWGYCEATVAHVWGMTLGDPRADKLHAALVAAGPNGLSRSEIDKLFGKNLAAEAIDRVSNLLVERELVTRRVLATGGRPRDVLVLRT